MTYSTAYRDAFLAFTIYDTYTDSKNPMVLGGTTISIFDENNLLRQGIYDLKVYERCTADGSVENKTPGLVEDISETCRLTKLARKYNRAEMAKILWLDRLVFRQVEQIKEDEKRESKGLYLMVEFPQVLINSERYEVVYHEMHEDNINEYPTYDLLDPDCGEVKSSGEKFRILSRSKHKSDIPNPKDRDKLKALISKPTNAPITSSDKDFIWNYRNYLCKQGKALPKFLRSVQWDKEKEVNEARRLLMLWDPMESQGSLELLSSFFTHPSVRKYAVARLNDTSDEDLLMYLLQLVQALRHEKFSETMQLPQHQILELSTISSQDSEVGSFHVSITKETSSNSHSTQLSANQSVHLDLASFLIKRSIGNPKLANYFYWYLAVECKEESGGVQKKAEVLQMYKAVFDRLTKALVEEGRTDLKNIFNAQEKLLDRIVYIMAAVAKEASHRLEKIKKLQSLLRENDGNSMCLLNFDPIPLPLDPDIVVKGIVPESATIFKSALMPCRLTFKTVDNKEYVTIFKQGDNLRQDQLVLQIIQLIDKLLKREKLDLKLTPYKVLATSGKHGFVQFIDSLSINEIQASDGTILKYFKRVAPSEKSPLGVEPEVIDNFVKSCAGYVIITYILQVGDRHNDNVLITKKGELFHIDFGYILGRDPKWYQVTAVKITEEMIDAMGGLNSPFVAQFRAHCYTAFCCLRNSANLILNLFLLMLDAEIPDIIWEKERTVKKLEDRFHLDMNDEEAVHHLNRVFDECLSSTMGKIYEQMHKMTQVINGIYLFCRKANNTDLSKNERKTESIRKIAMLTENLFYQLVCSEP